MEKNYIILAVLLFFSFSCKNLTDTFSVLDANYEYQKGNHHISTYKYLKILEKKSNDIVSYNLGNVYYLLGEKDSAVDLWEEVSPRSSGELKFRIEFNKGVKSFDEGNYSSAFDHFKNSLILNPSSLEAKRNLELTILKIETLKSNQEGSSSSSGRSKTDLRQHSNLLNYVKRQEIRQWKYTQEDGQKEKFQNDW